MKRGRMIRAALLSWIACSPWLPPALGAEIGNFCVHRYAPGRECTGSDVSIAALTPVSVLEGCASGTPGSAVAVFDLRAAAGGLSRYDIGLFLALNGGSALSGADCYHDRLDPPLVTAPTYGDSDGNGRPDIRNGPWWNGEPFDQIDDCGDMEGSTDIIKTLVSFRFTCADGNNNGIVDLHTCTSWSAGTQNHCTSLSDAYPGGNPRCGCGYVDTGIAMPGAEVASGRVAGLTLGKAPLGDLALSWGGSCAATDTDYVVSEGLLGSFTSHLIVRCTTGGATSATIQPRAQSAYYLVAPRNASQEGSYGRNSAGAERPPASNACFPQRIQSCP